MMPYVIPIILVAATAISAGIAAYSTVSASAQARRTAKSNAQLQSAVAEREQEISDREARSVERANEIEQANVAQTTAFEETQARRRLRILLATQRAGAAASGFETTSGTPLLQEIDNIQQAEIEALNIRRAGAVTSSSKDLE